MRVGRYSVRKLRSKTGPCEAEKTFVFSQTIEQATILGFGERFARRSF